MVHAHGRLVGYQGGHQMSVRCGTGIGIDHREEVVSFLRVVTSPGKQVVPGCFHLFLLRVRRSAEEKDKGNQKLSHEHLRGH
jgi:hypothetical protein